MDNRVIKKSFAITAMFVAVILLVWGIKGAFVAPNQLGDEQPLVEQNLVTDRHFLSGKILEEDKNDYFPIAVMIDNAYDLPYNAGLDEAHIIYEALVESNITRLLVIFDNQTELDKIGPVRSARNYFLDWAEEYGGVYMHVGGSPQALSVIDDYDFINIDQIGSGEIYFWRDDNLTAPHNVFTSYSNILRIGEIKEVPNIKQDFVSWHFVDVDEEAEESVVNFSINISNSYYKIDWKFNKTLGYYQRWQGEDKKVTNTGEQIKADNIIVQVTDMHLIDEERRGMDTESGGEVVIFNKLGQQAGIWKKENGRTIFVDENGENLKLVPGQTWVEIVDNLDKISV